MKFLTCLLALLSTALLTSQDLKTKKEYHNFPKHHKSFKELYTINKKTKLKEGAYLQLNAVSGDTLTMGYYTMGERTGPWKFYQGGGVLAFNYDYDTESFRFHNRPITDSIMLPVMRTQGFQMEKVDREPIFLGYVGEFKDRVYLPIELEKLIKLAQKKQGMTVLSMMVDARGKLRAVRIEETHDLEVAKMLVAAVKNVEGEWVPAIQDGIPVNTKIHLLHDLRLKMNPVGMPNSLQLEEKPGIYLIKSQFIGITRVVPANR